MRINSLKEGPSTGSPIMTNSITVVMVYVLTSFGDKIHLSSKLFYS